MKCRKFCLLFLFAALLSAGCRTQLMESEVPADAERVIVCRGNGGSAVFYDLDGFWAEDQSAVTVQKEKEEIVFTIRSYFPLHSVRRCEWDEKEPLSLFRGEHTELFLVPDGDQSAYYHFAVNPDGRTYLARRHELLRNTGWIRITVKKGKGFWDSIYRIPYAAIGTKAPKKGTVWRVNFCRLNAPKTGKTQWSAWNHSGSFHDISTMGALRFSPKTDVVPPPPIRHIHREKESVTLQTAEVSTAPLIEIKEGKTPWERKVVSPGVLTFFRRTTRPFHPLKSDVLLTLHAKEKNAEQLRSMSAPKEGDQLLLDRFYYTGEPIVCSTLSPAGTLRLLDDTGDLLQSVPVVSGQGKLDSAPLEPGSYIVEFQTANERTTRTIVKRGPWKKLEISDGKLQITDGRITRGKQPLYLIGISQEAKREDFYPFPPEFTYGLSCGLAENAVHLGSIPGGRIIRVVSLCRLMQEREKQEARYEEFFRELTLDSSAIYRLEYEAGRDLYFGKDEISKTFCPDPPAWYKRVAKQAKKAKPEILLSIHLDSQPRLAEYAEAADVLEFADWTASFAADDMMRHLPGAIARLRETVPDKPVIFWLGGSIPEEKERTPEELRAGIYLSLLAGFSGNVIHTGHGGIAKERTRMWSFLCGISREINHFYHRWVRGKEIPFPLPSSFAGQARQLPDGTLMLIIVNLRDGENHLTISKFERRFTPYEAAVLIWKDEIPQPLKLKGEK